MNETLKKFGGKVRVRACGLLVEEDKVLLIKHSGIGKKGYLWSPPGGGIEYQEQAKDAVKREFAEESGLQVSVENFLFVNEYIANDLHAIELFFSVKRISGKLILGKDPELSNTEQLIKDIRWFSLQDLKVLDKNIIHNVFLGLPENYNMKDFGGFFKFVDNSVK